MEENIKYISPSQIKQSLTMEKCIPLMREVFVGLSEGKIENQLRSVLPVEKAKLMGIMPGLIPYENAVGAKLITVFHENYKNNLPSHQGIVALFSTVDGRLMGVCDGMAITAIRTGAVSALATDCLANKNAEKLCLMGAGVQAQMHLDAICCVRDIKTVTVWSISSEDSRRFIEKNLVKYPYIKFIACENGKQAAENADIICTLTPSHTPVLQGKWLKKGVHINAVGACAAKDRELDSDCVKQSKFVCDSLVSCTHESGDYLFPLNEGEISEGHILAQLGDVASGKVKIRESESDITVFEALGLAVEDIACACYLLKD